MKKFFLIFYIASSLFSFGYGKSNSEQEKLMKEYFESILNAANSSLESLGEIVSDIELQDLAKEWENLAKEYEGELEDLTKILTESAKEWEKELKDFTKKYEEELEDLTKIFNESAKEWEDFEKSLNKSI